MVWRSIVLNMKLIRKWDIKCLSDEGLITHINTSNNEKTKEVMYTRPLQSKCKKPSQHTGSSRRFQYMHLLG